MVGPMNTKTLSIVASALAAVVVLLLAVMAVGAIPLGADAPSISDAKYAERSAAAARLQARLDALAEDVPPALPTVPERLSETEVVAAPGGGATGDAGSTSAAPAPSAQPAPTYEYDDDHGEEHEDDHGEDHDEDEGEHEDD